MKVAIYVRVSTNEQTTLNQELELKDYCDRNNHEIFNIYKDEGVSGVKTTRPELDNMLQDMRKKLFESIIVLKVLSSINYNWLYTIKIFYINKNLNLIYLWYLINSMKILILMLTLISKLIIFYKKLLISKLRL